MRRRLSDHFGAVSVSGFAAGCADVGGFADGAATLELGAGAGVIDGAATGEGACGFESSFGGCVWITGGRCGAAGD
jgi:hypothetical protein